MGTARGIVERCEPFSAMNPMNDQRFFDLAMRNIAQQATDAERAELDTLLTSHPELKAELEKLRTDARLAREVLPLAAAAESSTGQFPAYARERLQTKVRETLSDPQPAVTGRSRAGWRWVFGFVGASVVALMLVLTQRPTSTAPIVEVAMLDSVGMTRSADTNDMVLLKQQWSQSSARLFEKPDELKVWEQAWPNGDAPRVKVIYDRTAGEVRVLIRSRHGNFERTISAGNDLASALAETERFIRQHIER